MSFSYGEASKQLLIKITLENSTKRHRITLSMCAMEQGLFQDGYLQNYQDLRTVHT